MTNSAERILMLAGIQPDRAEEKMIELAERLAREYRYIDSAAAALRRIVRGPSSQV